MEERLDVEEQREASLPNDGIIDDKNVVVLLTNELTPIPNVTSTLMDSIHITLTESKEWQQLYEAVVMLRRVMVYHSEVITTHHIESFVRLLAAESDSLRSAPSKNGLLACAECFEFVPRSIQERTLLSSSHPEMLDVLLRRSVCEKKFLRDMALFAMQKLATHLAGLPLLTAVARYGTNKNGKLCGSAAKLIALSLECLVQTYHAISYKTNGSFKTTFRALAAFRESKDASARFEATRSLQLLCAVLGAKTFELGLKDALSGPNQAGIVARILKDACTAASVTRPRAQMRSLRDRVQQDSNARTGILTNCY
ncbi:Armadillo-type fold [Plasmopara halstedii]|uniref:Armadillo-type fold n=1 Tax=Plasmopara halstedii TaxID=4781 RepID=A0A0P1AHC1_PLAHL|nr:Armadillo-type fold [Plasmopara halstedii]CEG39873.1 Armadillo-type fold [Plasmopara halstedii]|eukprot:XP_024576242.1 Armadillo-type fold [Plasmopara halstedii]